VNHPMAVSRASAAAMWANDKASAGLGMALEHVAAGRARLSMTVRPEMVNGHGTCHGGFIFALADSAFAFACNSYGERVVAQHCAITFLRPATEGERLTAEAAERTRGRRSGIYDVRVTGANGSVVAELRGHSRTIGSTLQRNGDSNGRAGPD
jgi:acyl-CoA thioesterase